MAVRFAGLSHRTVLVVASLIGFSVAGCNGDNGDDGDNPENGTDIIVDAVADTIDEAGEDSGVTDTTSDRTDETTDGTHEVTIDTTSDRTDETTDGTHEVAPDSDVTDGLADWTMLVYLLADCDLEAFALTDLEEMAAVGSSDDVNWVLQVDRAEDGPEGNYSDEGVLNLLNWETTKRIYVEEGELTELADLGEVNMGLAVTLADFIQWGVTAYPAEQYALVFWGHGNAWAPFSPDASHDDPMTLLEIHTGIEDGLTSVGPIMLDLVGFDAGLMANIEVAYELRSVARFFVASEETEPGHGWGWTGLAEALNGNPGMTAVELGEAIANAYMAHGLTENPPGSVGLTMSVIDLSMMSLIGIATNTAADELANVLSSDGGFNQLGNIRARVEEYGTEPNPLENVGVVDLVDFIDIANDLLEDDHVFVGNIYEPLLSAIRHTRSGLAKPDSNGLSIYFPSQGDLTDSDLWDAYEATSWHTDTGWGDFLAAYLEAAASDTTEPTVTDVVILVIGLDDSITGATTLDDLAEVEGFLGEVVDTSVFVMGARMIEPSRIAPSSYHLRFTWDHTRPYFTDGTNDTILLLDEIAVYSPYSYETCRLFMGPAEYRATTETLEWIEVTLQFVWCYPNYSGPYAEYQQFAGAYFDTSGTPAEIELEIGGQVRPVWREIEADGDVLWTASEDPTDYISVTTEGFDFEYREVPAGDYQLGFIVTDLAGNVGADWEGVTISE